MVYRVYADGRPDELVRGVDIVGTPLTCFSKIIAAGDDPAVFNGSCGAESGWVPVSAVAPSILVGQIEIEKRKREQDKPPILPPPIAGTQPADLPVGDQAITRAMADELKRAMTLHMEDLEKPYFVQFDVDDATRCQLSAEYGAMTGATHSRSRGFRSHIRVGNMELDNTNFMGGGRGGAKAELPISDDYLALRQGMWQAADNDYKNAVETLTRKKAYMKDKTFADRANDFSPAPPVEKLEPLVKLRLNEAAWTENLKRISGHFKKYPQVQESVAQLVAAAQNSYVFNSEGTRLRNGDTGVLLTVSASVQADDGIRLSDSRSYCGDSIDDLPAVEKVIADVDAMVAVLTSLMNAPILDRYSGPVLFDDIAAPEMFGTLLASGLAGRPEPVGGRRASRASEDLETKIGTRILPKTFQVWDDPTVKKYADTPLVGAYRYDDEGVPAVRVGLVTDGKLETLCMSRAPTKKVSGTNGHGRQMGAGGMQAAVGCLFIEDKKGVPADELKTQLISAAKDAGLEYGVRVKSLRQAGAAARGSTLNDPLAAYKVYVADGHEEPFRGCEFGTVDVTLLKKLAAAGDTPRVYNYAGGGSSATLIAPAALFEELELSKIEQEFDKLPILKAPLAR